MKIHLIAVGQKMPAWVEAGYREYAQRLPRELQLQLREIPAGKRGKNADLQRIAQQEADKIQQAIPPQSHIVALDERGSNWSTRELADRLQAWMQSGQDVCLLVGGPEGFSAETRAQAHELWSLSRLTFPHPMVRVMLAEQLYRAWSLLSGHPYHRE